MIRPVLSNVPTGNCAFSSAVQFSGYLLSAETNWWAFINLILGGWIEKTNEGCNGTYIEGGKLRREADFFSIDGKLTVGGYEIITGCSDFDEAQRIATHLCDLGGLTLSIEC